MEDVTLRPATSSDVGTLLAWVPDAKSALNWAGPGLPFPCKESELEAVLDLSPESSFVLETDAHTAVGFGQLLTAEGYRRCHLARLIIDPSARGRGLGRRLVQLLIDQPVHVSDPYFTLNVLSDNYVAKALYVSLGFKYAERPPSDPSSSSDYMRLDI